MVIRSATARISIRALSKGHGLVGGVIVTVLVVGLVLLVLATLFQTFGPVLPFPQAGSS